MKKNDIFSSMEELFSSSKVLFQQMEELSKPFISPNFKEEEKENLPDFFLTYFKSRVNSFFIRKSSDISYPKFVLLKDIVKDLENQNKIKVLIEDRETSQTYSLSLVLFDSLYLPYEQN